MIFFTLFLQSNHWCVFDSLRNWTASRNANRLGMVIVTKDANADQTRPDFATEASTSDTQLRHHIKAHLRWCAFLGGSVDEESMNDLSRTLHHTAMTMLEYAQLAEDRCKD